MADHTSMDDNLTRNQKKEGSAVSDSMRFNVKPVAVRSENILTSIKSSNGNAFSGDGSSQVIFDVPAMAGGYYLDTASSRFSFNIGFTDTNGNATNLTGGTAYLDRGLHSLFNRWQLYDASGHLLEDIQNYHLLYAITELCTANPIQRQSRGSFYKECRGGTDPTNGGGLYGASTADAPILTTATTLLNFSLTFNSAIFGGGATKYYPLSAMNGFRIVLTLNNFNNAFACTFTGGSVAAYRITDPTIYTNMIRVDPAVDRGLIASSRGKDGRIRIPTQSWRTYTAPLQPTDTVLNRVIPISVSSLKALFFCFVNQNPSLNQSATACYARYLQSYQLFVGSIAIPTTPVQVVPTAGAGFATYNEAISETMRAWHVRIQDADWPSMFTNTNGMILQEPANINSPQASNIVFGVELESMSNKSNVIESGANVLNNNIELRCNFTQGTTSTTGMNVVFFALHDVFIVIDPDTGISSLEF